MASKIQKPSNMFALKLFSTFACLVVDCQNWASNIARTHLVNHMWQGREHLWCLLHNLPPTPAKCSLPRKNPPEAKTRLTVSVF